MFSQLVHAAQSNSPTVLILLAISLSLYVVARILAVRWHVAATFSTLPMIVFYFHTQNGGAWGAGIF